ncbi:MAG: NAD(P)-dependent oxidoreductase [Clostridia bacterium]
MNIVLLESLAVSDEVLNAHVKPLIDAGHTFKAYDRNDDVNVQIEQAKDANVIIIGNMPLKGELIRACKNLEFIDVAFTGVDHVDLEVAKEMGVKVSNASGYSNESVAELVFGMIFELLRNISKTSVACRNGLTKDGLVGNELIGKTVGVVGCGAIGKRVIEILKVFKCEIIGYDPYACEIDGVKMVSLEELFKISDVVTIHCPANAGTIGLVSKELIDSMKKSAILINCARGPIVDVKALADALNEERIAGAGVDVFEVEPPLPLDLGLLHSKNTLVTPHIAFATKESMVKRAKIIFDSLDSYLSGEQVNIIL